MRYERWQVSISGLLCATFWIAVLLMLTLATFRLHQGRGMIGFDETPRLGSQVFLNLGIGIAIGGWIGGLRWPGMGMLIGLSTGAVLTAIWLGVRTFAAMSA